MPWIEPLCVLCGAADWVRDGVCKDCAISWHGKERTEDKMDAIKEKELQVSERREFLVYIGAIKLIVTIRQNDATIELPGNQHLTIAQALHFKTALDRAIQIAQTIHIPTVPGVSDEGKD